MHAMFLMYHVRRFFDAQQHPFAVGDEFRIVLFHDMRMTRFSVGQDATTFRYRLAFAVRHGLEFSQKKITLLPGPF